MYRVLSADSVFKLQRKFLFWWVTVERNTTGAATWLERYDCDYYITLNLEE